MCQVECANAPEVDADKWPAVGTLFAHRETGRRVLVVGAGRCIGAAFIVRNVVPVEFESPYYYLAMSRVGDSKIGVVELGELQTEYVRVTFEGDDL